MQKISEFMSRDVHTVAPEDKVQHAAQLMREFNIGALPVCEGDRLVGIVTDRDIVVRSTAHGVIPEEEAVAKVMSQDVHWCFDDQPVAQVMQQMADSQVRRMPVLSHDGQRHLVGIVAMRDLALEKRAEPRADAVAALLEKISADSDQRARPH